MTLVFNKFGDTNVAYYRIYGGPLPHPATVLEQSRATLAQITNLANGPYFFRVTAVNFAGVESPFSNEERLDVNFTRPGQDMLQNGGFALGTNSWSLVLNGAANGTWQAAGGTSEFFITNGGASLSSVQLVQGGVGLVQGQEYVLEFDAWAAQPGYLQAQVAQAVAPFLDYSGLPATFLTPNPSHFLYRFTMGLASDFSARLVFNLGGTSAPSVSLANVSLFRPIGGDLNLDGRVDLLDLGILCGGWLTHQANLQADLDADGSVDFKDFSLLGQNWGTGTP